MLENEKEIIKQAANGDDSAFEKLVLEYQNTVYRLAYRMCGNRDDALDVSQNAFIKAWRAIQGFEQKSSFGTWIYRITVNAAKDFLSRKTEHAELPTDEDRISVGYNDVEERAINREMAEIAMKALEELSSEHREIIVLREMENKSYREISELLCIEEGTVKSRINRARAELKKIYLNRYENREQNQSAAVKKSGKGGREQ